MPDGDPANSGDLANSGDPANSGDRHSGQRLLRRDKTAPDAEILELPSLPRGFAYTDLFVVSEALVLPWEELDFVHVGRAGLLLISK